MPDPANITYLKRTNTIVFDIKEAYGKPKVPYDEWIDFLLDHVGTAEEFVEASIHGITGHLLVKFRSEEKYKKVLEEAELGVQWEKVGQKVYGWSISDILTSVRVINNTVHIDLEKVKGKMMEYGKIIHCQENLHRRLRGVKDGSITFKMKLYEDAVIPAFIDIVVMGECLQLFTEVNSRVCYKCTRPGHIAAFCKAKPREVRQTQSSWAKIVSGEGEEGGEGRAPLPSPCPTGQEREGGGELPSTMSNFADLQSSGEGGEGGEMVSPPLGQGLEGRDPLPPQEKKKRDKGESKESRGKKKEKEIKKVGETQPEVIESTQFDSLDSQGPKGQPQGTQVESQEVIGPSQVKRDSKGVPRKDDTKEEVRGWVNILPSSSPKLNRSQSLERNPPKVTRFEDAKIVRKNKNKNNS